MAAEDVLVMNAPKLQVLAHTGASHQPESPGPCCLCQLLDLRLLKLFLEMDEDGVLMSGNHDIDVVRVNHPKANRGRGDFGLAQHDVIQQVGQHQTVYAGGNAQLETVKQHVCGV